MQLKHAFRECPRTMKEISTPVWTHSLDVFACWLLSQWNIECPKKTFFCPIKTFHFSNKEPHIWVRHNKTNNFWELFKGTKARFLGHPINLDTSVDTLSQGVRILNDFTIKEISTPMQTHFIRVYLPWKILWWKKSRHQCEHTAAVFTFKGVLQNLGFET